MYPGTNRGEEAIEDVPPGVELQLRGMIIVGCPHGADQRDVVDLLCQVWPPVRDLNAALPMLPESDLHREELLLDLMVARLKFADVFLHEWRCEHIFMRCLLDRQPCVLGDL